MIAERVIVEGKDWNSGSRRLLQWLNLMDAKTTHMGGRHLLTDSTLEMIVQTRSKISHVVDANESENGSLVEFEGNSETGLGSPIAKRKRRLDALISPSQPLPSPRVIKLNMFNIILQPALEFHLLSASYSRRIGAHDRHHRSRDTVEDEYEVVNICRRFEEELEDLWRQRPAILNLTADQMSSLVCVEIATRLEQLFSVYIASFWTHFIYIHRVAYWSLAHSPVAITAIQETSRMMRRSVGEDGNNAPFDTTEPRTVKNTIHPGLMWPCFMLGCEILDEVEQEWVVLQLKALGELGGQPKANPPLDTDGLPPPFLDRKGAQNALKASILLKAQIERQKHEGRRVDGKFLAKEIFGCHFYII
jgi:hypothetical protein